MFLDGRTYAYGNRKRATWVIVAKDNLVRLILTGGLCI